ncbi:hypothetical protein ACET9I_21805 [Aeromonas veronii]
MKECKDISSIGVFFLLISFVIFSILGFLYPTYSTDSWGYLELSNSISKGGYSTNIVRQYSLNSHLSNSFPFFYPMVLYLFSFLGFGIYTGTLINIIVFLVSIWLVVFYLVDRKYFGLIALALVVNVDFLYEIISARSIPIALLLSVLLYLAVKNTRYNSALLLMGFMCLNRFDAYPFVFSFLIFIYFYCGHEKYIGYFPFIVLSLIWPAYSMFSFNQFFSTENSIAFSQNLPVTDVLYWDAPKIGSFLDSLSIVFHRLSYFPFLFLLPLVLFFYKNERRENEMLSIAFCSCLYISVIFIYMTGYKDPRYLAIYSLFISIHFCNYHLSSILPQKTSYLALSLYLSAILLLLLSLARFYVNYHKPKDDSVVNIERCLSSDNTLLVIGDNLLVSRLISAKASVLLGVKSVMQPTNLNSNNINEVVDRYDITHLYFLDYSGNIINRMNGFKKSLCNSLYENVRN